jgi:hypothetical protein
VEGVFAGAAALPGTVWCCFVAPRKPLAVRGRRPWGLLHPGDQKVYIDLGFTSETSWAPGDFARAYVIAEVGHHVQNLLASAKKMEQTRSRVRKVE